MPPSRSHGIPAYRQIALALQRRIDEGEWGAGGQLPTEPQLRQHLNGFPAELLDAWSTRSSGPGCAERPAEGARVLGRSAGPHQASRSPDGIVGV